VKWRLDVRSGSIPGLEDTVQLGSAVHYEWVKRHAAYALCRLVLSYVLAVLFVVRGDLQGILSGMVPYRTR